MSDEKEFEAWTHYAQKVLPHPITAQLKNSFISGYRAANETERARSRVLVEFLESMDEYVTDIGPGRERGLDKYMSDKIKKVIKQFRGGS